MKKQNWWNINYLVVSLIDKLILKTIFLKSTQAWIDNIKQLWKQYLKKLSLKQKNKENELWTFENKTFILKENVWMPY